MNFYKKIFVLILLISVVGCANIKKIDNVEGGNPKGFVKFIAINPPSRDSISIYEDNKFVWSINQVWSLKVAKAPGRHCFSATTLGSKFVPFCVNIEEGMITPVAITYVPILTIDKHHTFRLDISVGDIRQPTADE